MFVKFSSIHKVTFKNTIEDFELNISQVFGAIKIEISKLNLFSFISREREREIVKVQTNVDALTYLPLPPVIHRRISDRKK